MKKFLSIIMIVSLLFCMLVGCTDTEDGIEIVRVNEVTHSIFYAPFYLAIELGYFEEEGIEIELTNGGGSNISMTAVVSGSADIGLVGPETVVYVESQGKTDYVVTFAQLTYCDGSFLVGYEEAEDFDYSNLIGTEVIAGRLGGLPAMTLEYVLNMHGLYDGVNVTLNHDVEFALMAAAFEAGTGDYTTMFEPTASDYDLSGRGNIVASIGEDSGSVPYTCFVAELSYIEENTELCEGFVRAIYKALAFMSENDASVVATYLAPQFEGTSEEQIENAVNSYLAIGAWQNDMSMTEDSWERLIEIMKNADQFEDGTDANYDKLVDNTISEKIKAELS